MTTPRCAHQASLAGRRDAGGFTLIEMLVVMTMIALLLSLVVPSYFNAIDNGKLSVQRQNLSTMRDAIDKFYGDQGRYPETIDELVTKRYLRSVPVDPVTETTNWSVVAPPDSGSGAVFDVQPVSNGAAPGTDPGAEVVTVVESD
jgi:general secretion pathway protein G